jgi:colanic acid biosynthesis glycosyl transferase WcaI
VTYFASACLASLRIPRPDVVVALTDPPIIGLTALMTAKRTGARFVFLCQDVFPEVGALLEDFHNEAVNRTLDTINRLLLRRADAVVAVGETMKRRLVEGKGADPAKVTVIHNWADCSALVPVPRDNAFARAHGLHDRFVVMHAGNIGLSQNLDVAIDAAERLRGHDEIRFVFVGDGARRAALEARVRERGLANVVFLPYQPRDRMPLSYGSADVFLVSLKPGLAGYIVPSKVYGILAAGRPYVAAIEGASEVAEIARQYRCGVVVAPGDADALAASLLEFAHDRDRVAGMGHRAREAGLMFDRERQTSAYASLLHRLARRNAATAVGTAPAGQT